MAATMLHRSPLPKRVKLDDSQQVDSEDLSFLDEIDVDEIADYLNKYDETSHEDNIRSKSSTPTIKEPGDSTPCSDYSLSSDDDTYINQDDKKLIDKLENINPRKDDKKLIDKLEKKMFRIYQEHYVSSVIHYGKYSTIIQCKNTACEKFAVKILKDERQTYHGKAKERMLLQIQKNIPRDNLFCIYFSTGFSLLKRWCFMMEFYPKTLNQAMQEFNKPFHINKVQELARQLVAAVAVLKYNDIVHSDIKPSHILLNSSNEKLRLCGFDDAYYYGAGISFSNLGTVNYRPPEIILGYSSGFSIDVWSTAIVMVEMATGFVLFPGYTNNDILFKQMCMFGNIPNEMLAKSRYKCSYFAGNMFKRKVGAMKRDMLNKFYPTDKLSKRVLEAQTNHWLKDYEHKKEKRIVINQKNDFLKKIHSFIELIMQMFVLVPEDRFSIDIVYSDPFIYEMFD